MKKLAHELPLEILVAEDNFINQKLMLDILMMQGYKGSAASSGFEVLEALRKKKFDLILMDIQMPGMSGEETMQKIREEMGQDAPRMIAVTAYAMSDDREKYLSAGMDGYLSKPYKMEQLFQEIRRVMQDKNRK